MKTLLIVLLLVSVSIPVVASELCSAMADLAYNVMEARQADQRVSATMHAVQSSMRGAQPTVLKQAERVVINAWSYDIVYGASKKKAVCSAYKSKVYTSCMNK